MAQHNYIKTGNTPWLVSFTHAQHQVLLSSARAKETRWAISSSIGVTQENSARGPDPGQFFVYLVVMLTTFVVVHV